MTLYLFLSYLLVILFTLCAYHLIKRYFKGRKVIASSPTYPFVKAFSILLIAFTVRNGLNEILMPLIVKFFELEDVPIIETQSNENMMFYVVVGVIAIAYASVLKTNDKETNSPMDKE